MTTATSVAVAARSRSADGWAGCGGEADGQPRPGAPTAGALLLLLFFWGGKKAITHIAHTHTQTTLLHKIGPEYWDARVAAWRAAGEAARAAAEEEDDGRGGSGARGGGGRYHRRPVIDPDATYETLLMSEEAFPEPIPLDEIVDFLVDVWVEDGLYGMDESGCV